MNKILKLGAFALAIGALFSPNVDASRNNKKHQHGQHYPGRQHNFREYSKWIPNVANVGGVQYDLVMGHNGRMYLMRHLGHYHLGETTAAEVETVLDHLNPQNENIYAESNVERIFILAGRRWQDMP